MTSSAPRITARVDQSTQKLLSQAAAIVGVSSINSFVLNAAIEKAKAIMHQELSLNLSEYDAKMLAKALDGSAKPNPKLKKAAKRYRAKFKS